MYGVQKYVYGSVPRAVASALQAEARSLPLAVLIRRAFFIPVVPVIPVVPASFEFNSRLGLSKPLTTL